MKKIMRRLQHRIPVAPPGTVFSLPNARKTTIYVIAYNEEHCTERKIEDVAELKTFLEQWRVTWVNVDGLGGTKAIQAIGELFGLHSLALEDVMHLRQHPKVEEYGEHLFLVARMLEPEPPVCTEQLGIFLGKGFVLTFQEHPGDCLDEVRNRIRTDRGRVRRMDADYLAYCLLDAVIDGYYPYLDDLAIQIEDIEDEVLARPKPKAVSEIHQIKRDLLAIRRVMVPLREAINSILRDESPLFAEATRVFLRDCYDHSLHVAELVETNRELVGGLLDVYLSSVSNRTNEIMKVLTIIATLFIPLTFLCGVYGMNFNTEISPLNMPELTWYWGYPMFIAVSILVIVVELLFFWRRGWLGKTVVTARKDDESDKTP
ncbi:MAG TPA: magnesium/cobalt transporter CorA [Candidatus Hydrogenedentes bacterium]|nr:magnesium/cobalt transporter CorA [Candidatus Hydrogenedentota bacterium]HPG68395.1 magnesium/cobalt transporter CorA [Candidatus Hydrogenedentota bacterium]